MSTKPALQKILKGIIYIEEEEKQLQTLRGQERIKLGKGTD
jgi:hypothetical protein